MVKSFAQLKRDLQVGVKVKTIKNTLRDDVDGEVREISIVQTNGIAFKTKRKTPIGIITYDSWIWWQKAKNYIYVDNIFKVLDDDKKVVFIYEILK